MDIDSKCMSHNFQSSVLAKDFYEYERLSSDISVVGSLARHIGYWESIGAPEYILNIIRHGYTIPFKRLPKPRALRNNFSSRSNPDFVRTAVDNLIHTGAVREVSKAPTVMNPLTVSNKNGKQRLVLDLRHVNRNIHLTRCKIEGADILQQHLHMAEYFFGFDLKSGYHHIDINPIQQQYLGFSFKDHRGKTRYFVFKVLPFGLNVAGFLFTKLLRVLIRLWRSYGVSIVVFFDDGMGAGGSYNETREHSSLVKDSLIQAGYIPNVQKSSWEPVKVLCWLGFVYDLIQRIVYAEQTKLDKTVELLKFVKQRRSVHIRKLASLSGSITALHPAMGDVVYLKSKRIQAIIGWDMYVNLDGPAKQEVRFWLDFIPRNNGMPILSPIASSSVSFSDASGKGCASIITPVPEHDTIVVHRDFSQIEQASSSTYRELVAVYHGLENAKERLKGHALRWFTDAKNVVAIIRKGSMNPVLLDLAILIYKITKQYHIRLAVTWIPREENDAADFASRIVDHDDWGVDTVWFHRITRELGTPGIDRFADEQNRKCTRFNSRFFCQSAEATDAFTQVWSNDINWLVPPLYLVARALRYLKLGRAAGILVVPIWVSAHYWPVVQEVLDQDEEYVCGRMVLGNVFKHYRNTNSILGSSQWSGRTLALAIDYRGLSSA